MPTSIAIPENWTKDQIKQYAHEGNVIAQRALSSEFYRLGNAEEGEKWGLKASENGDPVATSDLCMVKLARGDLYQAEQLAQKCLVLEKACDDEEYIELGRAKDCLFAVAKHYDERALQVIKQDKKNVPQSAIDDLYKAVELAGLGYSALSIAIIYLGKNNHTKANEALDLAFMHSFNPRLLTPAPLRSEIHNIRAQLIMMKNGEAGLYDSLKHLQLAIAYSKYNLEARDNLNLLLSSIDKSQQEISIENTKPVALQNDLYVSRDDFFAKNLPEVPEIYFVAPQADKTVISAINHIGYEIPNVLTEAAQLGDVDIIEQFAQNGVYLKNEKYQNLPFVAAKYNQITVIDLLHMHGFRFNKPREDGLTALGMAVIHNNMDALSAMGQREIEFRMALNSYDISETANSIGITPELVIEQQEDLSYEECLSLLRKYRTNSCQNSSAYSSLFAQSPQEAKEAEVQLSENKGVCKSL